MASHVFRYPVPEEWYRQWGVRRYEQAHWLIIVLSLCLRYGFHGTSHDFVVQAVGRMVEGPAVGTRVVSCHLGAGCSVAGSVVGEGGSRDTSMGFSPLSGLMMATRTGDIDPSLVTFMAARLGVSAEEVVSRLNNESGFLGVAGTPDSR